MISEYLSKKMEEKNLNQTELAREVGLSIGTISKWLRRNETPDLVSCLKLAACLTEDPVVLLEMVGRQADAELVRKFVPESLRPRVSEDNLYESTEHRELHRGLQRLLQRETEGEIGEIDVHFGMTLMKRSLDALLEKENFFRHFVEKVKLIPWEMDAAKWRVTYIGPQAEKILGYSKEEWYKENFWIEHIHNSDRDWVVRYCLESTMKGTEYDFEYRMIASDHHVVWLRNIVHVGLGVQGAKQLRGFMLDITEQKKMAETIAESQRTLSTLMGNLPGMAYRCRNDRNWTMEFVSDGCYELTGLRPSELCGSRHTSFGQLVHCDDRERVWNNVQGALKENNYFQLEYRLITVNDELKWVWEQGRGVFSSDGYLVAIEGFITDITKRVRMEQALKESDEQYRMLFEDSKDACYVTTRDGKIIEANSSMMELFGYRSEEMIGLDVLSLYAEPEQRSHLELELEQQGHVRDYKVRLKRRDEKTLDCLLTSNARRAEDGHIAGYLGIIREKPIETSNR
ncbi:MAG: PAS domain S-box protein [Acidobacteria bacterium]|nr:PAS domain S-box protein [Acidobacteriota bacterium]MCI0721454.1 PAS domain S-box protein [Acidobacteriota bacterium]